MGLPELERAFLSCPGVDPSLVPEGWLENHYRSSLALGRCLHNTPYAPCSTVSTPCCRWIVWSLASRERRQGVAALAPAAVMDRLKLRCWVRYNGVGIVTLLLRS